MKNAEDFLPLDDLAMAHLRMMDDATKAHLLSLILPTLEEAKQALKEAKIILNQAAPES